MPYTILELVVGTQGRAGKRKVELNEEVVRVRSDDAPAVQEAFAIQNIDLDAWLESLGKDKLNTYQEIVNNTKHTKPIIE